MIFAYLQKNLYSHDKGQCIIARALHPSIYMTDFLEGEFQS